MVVYKKYGGSGNYTPQQMVIMDKKQKQDELIKKEYNIIKKQLDESKSEKYEKIKNKVSVNIGDNKSYEIIQFTSTTIHVLLNGKYVGDRNNKKHLRDIAEFANVNIYNGNGNPKNTRTLGNDIIYVLNAPK